MLVLSLGCLAEGLGLRFWGRRCKYSKQAPLWSYLASVLVPVRDPEPEGRVTQTEISSVLRPLGFGVEGLRVLSLPLLQP